MSGFQLIQAGLRARSSPMLAASRVSRRWKSTRGRLRPPIQSTSRLAAHTDSSSDCPQKQTAQQPKNSLSSIPKGNNSEPPTKSTHSKATAKDTTSNATSKRSSSSAAAKESTASIGLKKDTISPHSAAAPAPSRSQAGSFPQSKYETTALSDTQQYHPKIEVLPFRVSTDTMIDYLTKLASKRLISRVKGKWGFIQYVFLMKFGLLWLSDKAVKPVTQLKRISPAYVPTWIVDFALEIECKGNDGRATTSIISIASRFPGHTKKPVDSIPMFPPPPRDAGNVSDEDRENHRKIDQALPAWDSDSQFHPGKRASNVFMARSLKKFTLKTDLESISMARTNQRANLSDLSVMTSLWDNLDAKDYQPYKAFLESKKTCEVDVKGGIPEAIPFTVSPLQLPDVIRNHLNLSHTTIRPTIQELLGHSSIVTDMDGQSFDIPKAMRDESKDEIGAQSPPLVFDTSTLKLDMMAAYPILMPLYLAEFRYTDSNGKVGELTYAYGAWDNKGLQYCVKEADQDWKWSLHDQHPLNIDTIGFFPRVPIKNILTHIMSNIRQKHNQARKAVQALAYNERIKGDEKAEEESRRKKKLNAKTEKEWSDIFDKANQKSQESLQEDIMLGYKEIFQTEIPFQATLEKQSLSLLQNTKWAWWEQRERDAYIQRTSVTSRTVASNFDRTDPMSPHLFTQLPTEEERLAEEAHSDRRSGLGRYIFWTSPHVQRYSQNAFANREYLSEGHGDVLANKKRMASLVAGGHQVDSVLLGSTRTKGSRYDPTKMQTLAAHDLDARQKRERLRPKWLKDLMP